MAGNNNGGYQPSLKRRYFEPDAPSLPLPMSLHAPGSTNFGPPVKRPPNPMRGSAPGPWDKGPMAPWDGTMGPSGYVYSPRPQQFDPPVLSQSPAAAATNGEDGLTNLIVNYLPQALTDEELHGMFVPYGQIESCRIVRDKNTGYSFGYGFVKYDNPSSASMAISILNGRQVMNKVIKVSFARPPSVEIKDTNLYITNLPRTTTEIDLVKMFAPFGNIVQKNLLFDKYTQLPRGVAFVRYDRREEANAAIEQMNGYIPDGTEEAISVRLAENHGKQKASYVSGFQAGYHKRFQ